MKVPLMWGDTRATWGGEPLLVDPDEWDAMALRLREICDRITSKVPPPPTD